MMKKKKMKRRRNKMNKSKKKKNPIIIMLFMSTKRNSKMKNSKMKRTSMRLRFNSKKVKPRTTNQAMKVLMRRLVERTWDPVTLEVIKRKEKKESKGIDLQDNIEAHTEEEVASTKEAIKSKAAKATMIKKVQEEEDIMCPEVAEEVVDFSKEADTPEVKVAIPEVKVAIQEEKVAKTMKAERDLTEVEVATSIKARVAEEVTRDKESSLRKRSQTLEMMDSRS